MILRQSQTFFFTALKYVSHPNNLLKYLNFFNTCYKNTQKIINFIRFVWWEVTRYLSLKVLKLLLYLRVQTKNWLYSGPGRNLASALLLSKWQHMISGTNSLSSILKLVNRRKISVQSCTHHSGNNVNLIEDLYYANIKWTLENVVVTVGSIRFQEVCVYSSYTCNVHYWRFRA